MITIVLENGVHVQCSNTLEAAQFVTSFSKKGRVEKEPSADITRTKTVNVAKGGKPKKTRAFRGVSSWTRDELTRIFNAPTPTHAINDKVLLSRHSSDAVYIMYSNVKNRRYTRMNREIASQLRSLISSKNEATSEEQSTTFKRRSLLDPVSDPIIA